MLRLPELSMVRRLPVAWPAIAVGTLLIAWATCAQTTIELNPEQPRFMIDEGVEYLIEGPDRRLSLDDVRSPERSDDWTAISGVINFGFQRDAVWYRLDLRNTTPESLTRHLEIRYPLLTRVDFHHVVDDQLVTHYATGLAQSFRERPINYRTFVLPFSAPGDSSSQIYLRIQTNGSHQVPMVIWDPGEFLQAAQDDLLIHGMFYGTLLIMAVFVLLLYASIRERSLIYFSGVLFGLVISTAALHGTTFQYLLPNSPQVQERLMLTAIPMTVVFFCMFCASFLQLGERLPKANRLVVGTAGCMLIAFVAGALLPYHLAAEAILWLSAIVCIILLAVGGLSALRGNRNGIYFVIAWSTLLGGIIVNVLNLGGLTGRYGIIGMSLEGGAVFAAAVFAVALGERFRRETAAWMREHKKHLTSLRRQREAERQVVESARQHRLTGLPNRVALEQCLQNQINELPAAGQHLALVMLHLKNFDDLNRTLGHEYADQLLTTLARRLNDGVVQIPQSMTIAPSSSDKPDHALAHVEGVTFACSFTVEEPELMTSIMQHLADNVQQPLDFEQMHLSVGVVCGCAYYPDDSQDVGTLLRHAFIAYGSADTDVRPLAIYRHDENLHNAHRLTLMTDLKQAIDNDNLSLVFQPQVRGDSGEYFGMETLLRWEHPRQGFIPPDQFIPVAERSGLMPALTAWVLDKALASHKRFEQAGLLGTISVNISPVNLRDDGFLELVRSTLEKHQVEPHRLVLEVTETAAMREFERTLKVLRSLNDLNIQISIDDFGTGHSSLAYLRRLPVQEIKIDRSFVMEMDRNQDDLTIVRTIIDMCHNLGYRIVAEGIESDRSLQLLREMGCDVAQGYFIARPLPPDQAESWVQQSGTQHSGEQ
ncbi:EAL domain-containing protein [Wenzhouxiangella sp. AB-CW3]|uniref:EAL domain-containing protein n=1 Tax=Wenzhouxiangella sp. AB-CW3 TaxID=2771012 RepID=UPI00168B17D5|nr:EAL domain-containing protein [Wenzhouxiangella sp. AB-CW3]QOC23733.1 EAL domain-containing protein [Wenzhouxiangella sp. AB-CW3]